MTIVAEDNDIRIEKLDPGGEMWANPYLIVCRQTGEAALVDAPGSADRLLAQIKGNKVKYILMTHNHGDHISALAKLKEVLKVPVAGHELDAPKFPVSLDIKLEDGQRIPLGRLEIKVMHTPGHTRGSVCFLVGNYLIDGDTLFPHGPGHTVSPASFRQIIKSLEEKVFILPDDTLVFPGHGDGTVLGREKEEYRAFCLRSHGELSGDVLWLES
jgi:glyoxylase-like metal-dependent hydrolase (beta-lactamase superfamily II)